MTATSRELLDIYFSQDFEVDGDMDVFTRKSSGPQHDFCESLESKQERVLVAYLSGLEWSLIRRRYNIPIWQIQAVVDCALEAGRLTFPDIVLVHDPAHTQITHRPNGSWLVNAKHKNKTYRVGSFATYEKAHAALKAFSFEDDLC